MINLFKIKGQKNEEAANSKGGPPVKKQSPGELRLHKGLFRRKGFDVRVMLCYFQPGVSLDID